MRQFSEAFYLNEHLFYGHLGQFLIITAFITAFFVFLLGLKAYLNPDYQPELEKTSRWFYGIHAACVFGIIALLIFLFYNQYFEYHYIWRHSSRELPWYFILSAMWEGQEGSFLLWIFWHAVLGIFILRSKAKSKYGVLAILALVQVLLLSMVMGVDVFGKLIGSSPFILLRNEMNIPILQNPNYLELIKDGNGLNILLQNYWMVIHPPILFLGFASLTIPFGFAVSSLLKRDFNTWISEVSPWALFSVAVLGTGILMGGRWAYEALSFGGFWAWDPVENASLVPWLFLIAGVHTLMIYKATKHSLKSTYLFFTLAFGFILYSTFLTRSGILGDSSVHSFTDLGMTGQLLIFMGILILPTLFLMAFHWSKIPDIKKEETTSSREFWMFIGSLIIIVSAIQITYTTSIPVWNKLFDLNHAPPVNANEHYNSIQIWFTIIVCLLMGISLWMQYQSSDWKQLIKKMLPAIGISIGLALILFFTNDLPFLQKYKLEISKETFSFQMISSYVLLLFSSIFLIVSAIYFIIIVLKKAKPIVWGGSIAHLGFGIMILGALISQYQKNAISINQQRIDFGKDFDNEEQSTNTLLSLHDTLTMGDYITSYQGKSLTKQGAIYRVLFQDKDKPSDSFNLYPEAKFIQEGPSPESKRLNAEPSIAHLYNKDIFIHVSSVPQESEDNAPSVKSIKLHDTFYTRKYSVAFNKVEVKSSTSQDIIDLNAHLNIDELGTPVDMLKIPYTLNTKTGEVINPKVYSQDSSLAISIDKIDPEAKEFSFSIEDNNKSLDWIILKVIEFPHISILWIGCIIMVIGTLMSMWYRRLKNLN